ncbi:hypothetical protein ABMA27_015175 [Loxostege sticticalis]|uniref:Uncharacterized protein n=1 Tax=Loxostege sticticalis TaxID=481309 RepID=A0ABR3I6N9_LOXSC
MCRTVHAVLQTAICGIQMLVRVFMTVILMIENVIRMLLQTLYNFISFVLQMISLIPICIVFLLTARLKCFMCGGGGPCPVNRGGTCDCLMSLLAFVILFFIFRATGVLDKIFYSLGYAKARPPAAARFVPTMGDITECSRNDTETVDMDYEGSTTTPMNTRMFTFTDLELKEQEFRDTSPVDYALMEWDTKMLTTERPTTEMPTTKMPTTKMPTTKMPTTITTTRRKPIRPYDSDDSDFDLRRRPKSKHHKWRKTTAMYYLL